MPQTRRRLRIAPSSTPTSPGSPATPFVLHPEVWYAINAYVYTGIMLPVEPGSTLTTVPTLKEAYTDVRAHTTAWRDTTYPKTVELADDLVNFGYRAANYCESLPALRDELMAAPDGSADYDNAKRRMLAVFKRLIDGAKKNAARAAEVKAAVEKFRDDTKKDQSAIGTVKTAYDAEFGSESTKAQKTRKDIADAQADIARLTDEYTHYVTVAATTPTYAWIYPFGTIPAVVVAGVYGDRAVKAKRDLDRRRAELESLQRTERDRTERLAGIDLCVRGLAVIQGKMQPAIDSLTTLGDDWSQFARAMEGSRDAAADMRADPELVFDDAVLAAEEWHRIAAAADSYRLRAYITVEVRAA